MRGGIREGALENLCCVWREACVTSEPKHGVDHEGRFLGQLVSFGVNGGESFGEGCFACMYGGGAITVDSLKARVLVVRGFLREWRKILPHSRANSRFCKHLR